MTAPADKPAAPTLLPYVVLAGLCLGLALVAMMLRGRADEAHGRLARAKEQFRGMIKIRDERPSTPTVEHESIVVLPGPWTTAIGEITQIRKDCGILQDAQIPKIHPPPSGGQPMPSGQWLAYPIRIDLAGSKQAPLEVGTLFRFLDTLEKQKRFLKTTDLTLRLEEGNLLNGAHQITVSYWLPAPPKP